MSKRVKDERRPRAERREKQRALQKAVTKLDKLAADLPGGSAKRALDVSSASIVEVRARATRCLRCDGELQLQDHTAEVCEGQLLRVVKLACRVCHAPRQLWFRVTPSGGN